MKGESNLSVLLKTLRPFLNEGEFVFCCVEKQAIDLENTIFHFKEKEGISIICTKEYAIRQGYVFDTTFSWLTLSVHSSLEAVGLTAAFAQALAQKNISCNVVAGFYHDHIFVLTSQAVEALAVLEALAMS